MSLLEGFNVIRFGEHFIATAHDVLDRAVMVTTNGGDAGGCYVNHAGAQTYFQSCIEALQAGASLLGGG